MSLSYRKRESSPTVAASSQDIAIKNKPMAQENNNHAERERKSKSFGGFWSNFFRPSSGSSEKQVNLKVKECTLSLSLKPTISVSSLSSLESMNTIQSTHSFAFVSPRLYAGRARRKRGRRIPVDMEDNSFRSKPLKPQYNENKNNCKDGTFSKIGTRFGLKSKYNLQSCESLAVGNTVDDGRQNQVQKLITPGPSREQLTKTPCNHHRRLHHSKFSNQESPNDEQATDVQGLSDKQINPGGSSKSVFNQNLKLESASKKRRAPPPPPTTNIDITTLGASSRHSDIGKENEIFQRYRRCKSEAIASEQRFKPKAHVVGKRRAPTPPVHSHSILGSVVVEQRLVGTGKTCGFQEMPGKKKLPSFDETSQGYSFRIREQKPLPRPWYKRHNGNKSPTKLANLKPMISLPNISNLDREAALIVQENNRRSAETTYNQTAKDLITMFNSTFSKAVDIEPEGERPGPVQQSSKSTSKLPLKIIRTNGILPEFEEKKKLAIVQPQKFSTPKLGTNILQQTSAPSNTASALDMRNTSSIAGPHAHETWTCPRCTLDNSAWRAFCDVCFYRKDSELRQNSNPILASVSVKKFEPIAISSNLGANSGDNRIHTAAATATREKTVDNIQSNERDEKIVQTYRIPTCQNYLSELPTKENLDKEKMFGIKLLKNEVEGELDIEALREARVAFFTKNTQDNLIATDFKELNLPPLEIKIDEVSVDLEIIDFLLAVHEEKYKPEIFGGRANDWKSLNFQPIHEAILKSDPSLNFEKVYNDFTSIPHTAGEKVLTNTFIQNNIHSTIRKQLDAFEQIMQNDDMERKRNHEAKIEACRKQGAVPKHLLQPLEPRLSDVKSQMKDYAKASTDLLRKIDWAISNRQFRLAANFAYELATENVNPYIEKSIAIRVYVEDRMIQQGPFTISVTESLTVGALKSKIQSDWSIPVNFQKWILGKKMAESDDDRLAKYHVRDESLAFLYLVTPEFGSTENIEQKSNVSEKLKMKSSQSIQNEACASKVTKVPNGNVPVDDTKIVSTPAYVPENFEEDKSEILNNSSCMGAFISGNINEPNLADKQTNNIFITREINIDLKLELNNTKPEPYGFQLERPSVSKKFEIPELLLANEPLPTESQILAETTNHSANSITIPISQIPQIATLLELDSKHVNETRDQIIKSKQPNETGAKFLSNPSASTSVQPKQADQSETIKNVFYLPSSSSQSNSASFARPLPNDDQSQHFSKENTPSILFTRRPSGSLTKQIQMFEALNCPPKHVGIPSVSSTLGFQANNVEQRTKNTSWDDVLKEPAGNYKKLLELEKTDLIRSEVPIECPICLSTIELGKGVVLRECLHAFCDECLAGAIEYAEDAQVKCPYRDKDYACDCVVQEREIKALVPPELFHRILAKSVKLAECKMLNAFHCKTTDCPGWCVFEDSVNVFHCPVCSKSNCLNCRAIHDKLDCQQYQRKLAIAAETDEDAKSSRIMLEKMIERGEALDCPACHVVLLKKWGCDWVRCSYCKTEICWVTKSFRWGPNGKGDTSGGCKCGVNGVKCHPKCTYCH